MSEEAQETIEFSAQDQADIAKMLGVDPPAFHPILRVWREVLAPVEEELTKKVTPQWASRTVTKYPGLVYADMVDFRDIFYGKILELRKILDLEISGDSDCLTYGTPEEDVEHNSYHYRNLLLNWQLQFLQWELDWDCTDATAAIQLGAISEVHAMFFGQTGLTQYLDNIRFEFTEDDQAQLAGALEELKARHQEG